MTASTTRILYVPGLGDHYDGFRRACLKLWQLWGVEAELVPITWFDGGSFESKYEKVAQAIKRAEKNGKRVVVLGESAGATLALHVGKQPQVARIITLCGVTRRQTPVSSHLRRRAPALDTAVSTLPEDSSVDIHSIRAIADSVVRHRYSEAEGAKVHVVWSVGHLLTIALCLTLYAPLVASIAKSNKK